LWHAGHKLSKPEPARRSPDKSKLIGAGTMRNLEAKFRLSDLTVARDAAVACGYKVAAIFTQRDTFFVVPHGKLKLREQPDGAWLIHYERGSEGELMVSRYQIVPVAEPERIRAMLSSALGVLAEVRKHRTLLTLQSVRLHLDRVAELGDFGEIEAVLDDDEGTSGARGAVDELLGALGVGANELIGVSYFELMTLR
jgi:predicted adenylyl cyclase CyaB